MAQRNWKDSDAKVQDGTALTWALFMPYGTAGASYNQAPARDFRSMEVRRLQPTLRTDVAQHPYEQVYYFTAGRANVLLGEELVPVRDGDALHIPAQVPYRLVNDSDDWVEYLITCTDLRP